MGVTLKQFARGYLAVGGATQQTDDVLSNKVQVIRSIRLVNKHATDSVTLNLSVGPNGAEALIAPKDLSLGPGQAFIENDEIVLKTSDHFKAVSGTAGGPVDYVISGFEREAS